MGAGVDRRIGIDIDAALKAVPFTNYKRFRFDASSAGTPSHTYADIHSELVDDVWTDLDVPVTAADRNAVIAMGALSLKYRSTGNFGGLGDAIRGIMRCQWGDDVADHIMAVLTIDGTDVEDGFMAALDLLEDYATDHGVGA